MRIVLDDIKCKADLYPFTLTRSTADIRVGILTIREKWEILLNKKIDTVSQIDNEEIDKDAKTLPANILPSVELVKALKKSEHNIWEKISPICINTPGTFSKIMMPLSDRILI